VVKKTGKVVAGAVLLLLAWLLLVPPTGRPAGPMQPHNAVWLDRYWLRGDMSVSDMENEIARMVALNIKTLFVHAGPFNPDGSIPEYDPARILQIRAAAANVRVDVRVLAWLGGLNAAGGGDLDLLRADIRTRAAEETCRLQERGFDGIHLNIEPTPTGDEGFLLLLEATRACLPEGAFLSVATNLWGPWWLPNHLLFSDEYLRHVSGLVDQIAVMNYDAYAVTGPLFRRISAAQTRAALRAVQAANGRTTVLIGVPAYPTEGGLRHWAPAESVPNALAGIDAALASVSPAALRRFEGVALYAGWTASEQEWRSVGEWHGL
jgi:hypothetical protein